MIIIRALSLDSYFTVHLFVCCFFFLLEMKASIVSLFSARAIFLSIFTSHVYSLQLSNASCHLLDFKF